jgi:hypothetical protein
MIHDRCLPAGLARLGHTRAGAKPTEDRTVPKREVIAPENVKRYVRRDDRGRFSSDQVKTGDSLTADRRQQAKTEVPKGQGDRGDQRRNA